MDMKLLATFAVVIAFLSAITFVEAYKGTQNGSEASAEQTVSSLPASKASPSVSNQSSSSVKTVVEVGGGDVQAIVTVE